MQDPIRRHGPTSRPPSLALVLLIPGLLTWPGCYELPIGFRPIEHPVPADKGFSQSQIQALLQRGQQRVYVGPARTTLGMPCGGICAGQLYVLGDGTLSGWQIDGAEHLAGTGQTSYRTCRPSQPIAQGFAIATKDRTGSVRRATLDDAGYDGIEFVGEYPRAIIHYRTSATTRSENVPPVDVDLEVFSPFIPLDARNSAWPATVLRFTVRNPGDQPLEVALGGWLENMVYSDRSGPLMVRRRNRSVSAEGLTSVLMDAIERRPPPPPGPVTTRVLADFESGTYQDWTVEGTAFGHRPATGTLPDQQPVGGFGGRYLVNSYRGGDGPTGRMISAPFKIDLPYLTFRIGGGRQEGRTCLNLLVDGRVVRTATGRNDEKLEPRVWDVSDLAGQLGRLEIVDQASGGWGHVNIDDLALTNDLGDEYREYRQDALGYGNMAFTLLGPGVTGLRWIGKDAFVASLLGRMLSVAGSELEPGTGQPLVGTLTSTFVLAPAQTQDVTFIVSWYFPNLHTGHGRMYANWFEDAWDVARQLAADLPRLHQQTLRFCDCFYRQTTLPWWLASRLMMPVANLATGTAQWWKNGRFWAWEGAYCCHGTCTHVWNYAQAEAWLFPELARSTRTTQDLGEAFDEASGLVGFRSDRNFAADGQAGTVLKCYREHLTSPDDRFLRQNWPRIQAALEYLIREDGDSNGIIENDRQHNTYDINFVGANTFVGSLYLAALRAGEEMAKTVGDPAAADRYHELFERGSQWTVKYLFNGEYFQQRLPGGKQRPWQYGKGCLSDQLFGQTWAHLLNLGYLYPPEKVRSALSAVFRYNWAPDVGPLNARFPPERWFAHPGEPGLFVCTWPRGGRPAQPVRYRDEVWTGIEYQVASGLLWEGMIDPAVLILHGIDQRYDGSRHNPWNEVECGDHYARALACWGVLHALAGFTFDGPAGRLGFAPRIQKDDFACFFCAGTGWGTIGQQRQGSVQTNVVRLDWGTLRLSHLEVETPPSVAVRQVRARLIHATSGPAESDPIAVQFVASDQKCRVELIQPAELQPGQRLEISLGW